jgi:glycosyltransferase involved in cell wall biosynthesis
MKPGYIKQEERKKILFISDDIRFFSGIATISREIVLGTAHRFNYVIVGGSINHPDKGKRLDLCGSTNEIVGINDSNIILYPSDGYGNADMIRQLINTEKPDILMFITDPRYYSWLFQIEHEIRQKIPMVYLSIWDCEPAPLYNREYYRSCDALFCISKQTEILTKVILGDYAKNKVIKYVPHGINRTIFKPLDKNNPEVLAFKKDLLDNKEYEFVLLFNSRNIRRKSIPDTILSFKHFIDNLPKEKADKCCFVLHTQKVDENGTDLPAVIEMLLGERKNQVIFTKGAYTPEKMNLLYNCSDCVILLSSNEGWGLSITEGMMAGKMIIANVTGGMQDQMRFQDENGKWIEFNESFCTNHLGKYKECGEWAVPVFSSNISIQGSVPTPYIFDCRVDFRDAADAIRKVYDLSLEERNKKGELARTWVTSDESAMSADRMSDNIINGIDELLEIWKPKERYSLLKIEERPMKFLKSPVSLP